MKFRMVVMIKILMVMALGVFRADIWNSMKKLKLVRFAKSKKKPASL